MTYAEQLQSPYWQKKRLEILQRDNFTCQCCGETKFQLHVHHLTYIKNRSIWEYEGEHLITLCDSCHSEITQVKKEIKFSIDTRFIYSEPLFILNDFISILSGFTPDILEEIKEYIYFKYVKK